MADPNVEEAVEHVPNTPIAGAESPDEQGNEKYMENNKEIEGNEPMPHWSLRTSMKLMKFGCIHSGMHNSPVLKQYLNNFSIVPITQSSSGLYRSLQDLFHCLDNCSIHL